MTELEAINTLLRSVSTAPVNDVDTSNVRVALAKEVLTRYRIRILTEGWWFNTNKKVSLPLGVGGTIPVSSTYLKVSVYDPLDSTVPDITVRDSKLYDKTNNTDIFTEPVEVNIILELEWDALPEAIQELIVADAMIPFVEQVLDPSSVTQVMLDNRARARSLATQADFQEGHYDLLTATMSRYDIVNRRRNRIRRY